MPPRDVILETKDAQYFHFKSDVIKREMTYSTQKNSPLGAITISVERVREVMTLNAAGVKPDRLQADGDLREQEMKAFGDILGQDSISRFDKKKKKKKARADRGGEGEKPRQPRESQEPREPREPRAERQERPARQQQASGERRQRDNRQRQQNSPQGGEQAQQRRPQQDRNNRRQRPRNQRQDNRPRGDRGNANANGDAKRGE